MMSSPNHFHLNAYGADIEGYRPVDDGPFANNNKSATFQSSEKVKRRSGLSQILRATQSTEENDELSELSRQVQTTQKPLFIPRFDSLRKTCLEQTQMELQTIERELQQCADADDSAMRSGKVAVAVRLLQQLGQ